MKGIIEGPGDVEGVGVGDAEADDRSGQGRTEIKHQAANVCQTLLIPSFTPP